MRDPVMRKTRMILRSFPQSLQHRLFCRAPGQTGSRSVRKRALKTLKNTSGIFARYI